MPFPSPSPGTEDCAEDVRGYPPAWRRLATFFSGISFAIQRNVRKLFSCPDWKYLIPFLSCCPQAWSLETVGLAAQGTPGILPQWQPQQHSEQPTTPKASLKKLYNLQERGSQEIYLLAPCCILPLLSSSH